MKKNPPEKATFTVTIEVDGGHADWQDIKYVRARVKEGLLSRFAVAKLKSITKAAP